MRVAIGATVMAMAPAMALATPVTVEFIDGRTIEAHWSGCTDGNVIVLRRGDTEQRVQIDDVAHVSFVNKEVKPLGTDEFHLAGGSRLPGVLLDSAEDAIVVSCALGAQVVLSFDHLAGVRLASGREFVGSMALFLAALKERSPGSDVLITREVQDAKSLNGRIVSLNADGGVFEFGGRTRTFKRDKVFGIVMAAGRVTSSATPINVTLTDGSILAGRLACDSTTALRIEPTGVAPIGFAAERISRIDVRSNRVVYVSDLTPEAQRSEGFIHRPWPIRMDKSVTATPISIRGRKFPKGIGCHSRTELVYDLARRFDTFAATIGIDDSAGPGGNVVFRVLGDDRVLYESGPITGQDEPIDVVASVEGVDKLKLIVDYGLQLDVADHADWGNARLLKPPTESGAGQSR